MPKQNKQKKNRKTSSEYKDAEHKHDKQNRKVKGKHLKHMSGGAEMGGDFSHLKPPRKEIGME